MRASVAIPVGALVLVGVVAFASACASDEPRGRGAEEHDRTRARVVVLVPAITDLVVALGRTQRLAGRTIYDTSLSVLGVPPVGEPLTPNLEAIAAARPDLVIAWGEESAPGLSSRLRQLGNAITVMNTSTLADLRINLRRLGVILDARARADSLWQAIDSGLTAVARRRKQSTPRRVALVAWIHPLIVAGGTSYMDTLLTIAGAANVFHDVRTPWPTVSAEALLARHPDAVIIGRSPALSAADVVASPELKGLPAVVAGRVREIDGDLLDHPGPRIADAAAALARVVR